MGQFNYEKWSERYYNKKIVKAKEHLNDKDIEDLKKLGVEIEDKIYTESEWEVLTMKLLAYYIDENEELSEEEKQFIKSLKGKKISRNRYNELVEKFENINHIYRLGFLNDEQQTELGKIYSIISGADENITHFYCTEYDLPRIVEQFIKTNGKVFCVTLQSDSSKTKIQVDKISEILSNNRTEIIKQIQADLLDKCNKISPVDLEILSNNIYDFCCLKAHSISENEIIKYILNKNNKYYDTLSDDDKDNSIAVDYKILEELSKKYTEILKSNM